jgi:hypothetical protein
MFGHALKFNQYIGNWDVSNVTDIDDMFFKADSFKQSVENWNLSNYFIENSSSGLSDNHNEKYKFTKERLISFIEKYKNSGIEDKEKNKYDLMKYMKQYSEKNLTEFKKNMIELKLEINLTKELSI